MGAVPSAAPGHLSFTELLATVGGSDLGSRSGSGFDFFGSGSDRNGARASGIRGIGLVEDGEAEAACSSPTALVEHCDSGSSTSEGDVSEEADEIHEVDSGEEGDVSEEADEIHELDYAEEGDVSDIPNSEDDGREDLAMDLSSPTAECADGAPPSYTRRKRHPKGVELPSCRPPRGMGAVQIAMRASSTRKTEHIFQPTLGLCFDSVAEAYEFYNLYSWEVGFGIRLGSSSTNRGNDYRTMQEIECGNSGFDRRCQYQSQRCGCKAMIRLLRTDDHGWYMSLIRNEHNHDLSVCCGEKMQWKSHRTIDQQARDMIKYLRENNVTLSKVHCILGSMFGSIADLPFTKRSLRHICSQIAREQMDDDVKKTLEIFRKMRIEDPHFAFSVDVDQYNRIKTLIWSNNRSKMQYACFGDVLTFDTTYCTNIYKMPFGLFVGVNNHFQSIIYGGVLMRDEKIESFIWVFKEFLCLMGGKAPITILTDQCAAMGAALKETMPESTHLWCKWHVLRKAQESLGPVYSKRSVFRQQFHKVMNEMLTIDEFENAWEDLIERYNLRDNPFMIRTYEARHMWAKPYSKDKFCARMMSTQRVESANHMLKAYVPRNSSMNRFVAQYNNLLFDRGVEEDREEHKTKQVKKRTRMMWPVQLHASKIYTRATYKLFCRELDRATHYRVVQCNQTGMYELHHTSPERRECWARVIFKVLVIHNGVSYDCECGLYTHFGILCCHCIRLLIHLGVPRIPDAHVLKRWTRDARDVLPAHLSMYQKDNRSMQSQTFRNGLLYKNALEAVKAGNSDLDSFQIIMKHINEGKKEVEELRASKGIPVADEVEPQYESSDVDWQREGAPGYRSEPDLIFKENIQYGASGSSAVLSHKELMNIRAPLVVRSAGRPKVNRFRSPVELSKTKAKKGSSCSTTKRKASVQQTSFCGMCRSSGHNRTTCPGNPNAVQKIKKIRRCSICELPGHRSTNCHSKIPLPEDFELDSS